MIKRIVIGIVLGALVGCAVAAALVLGLKLTSFDGPFGTSFAYAAAAATGALTGFVTGKPIWSRDGKIEAILKALFGAGMAAGVMFALRRWIHVELDLSAFDAGSGSAGELVATTLPTIAVALGFHFEVDNTDSNTDSGATVAAGTRVAQPPSRVAGAAGAPRLAAEDPDGAARGDGATKKARR